VQTQVNNIKAIFFKHFFVLALSILGLISLALLLTKHEAEFTVLILEGVFMGYAFMAYWWQKKSAGIKSIVFVRWACFFYFAASYIYAVDFQKADPLDFLLIYKSFIYIFFLTFLSGKSLMTFEGANRMFFISLALFFLKYTFAILIRHADRPILYMENNFELMFVYALYLIRYVINKEKFLLLLGFVGLITILSLSRSSLLMYSVLVLFVIYDSFKKTRVFIIPGAVLVLGVVVSMIFAQRSSSLEDVDRYRFMLVWWSQVKDWDFFQWMVGAPRISRLSEAACSYMSYFKMMFSYSGDGTCYSVVLHSFLLRVVYDHGILGLVFIIYACYNLLVRSGIRKDVTWVFITIVIINGLSVSSFNNLFFAISMVFLMATNLKFPETEGEIQESLNAR
jgi:hypothetical protein